MMHKRNTCTVALTMVSVLFTACGDVQDPSGAYVDGTTEPLVDGASGRLRDLGVTCRLSPVPGSGNKIEMQLENLGDKSVEFLGRGTAWDHQTQVVRVSVDGRDLPYQGIIADRGRPVASEFQHIEPGELLTQVYDLGVQHHAREAGSYDVALRAPLISVRVEDVPLAMQHDCGVLHMVKSETAQSLVQVAEQPLIYNDSSCSANDQTEIERAEVIARQAVRIARSFVKDGDPLYTEWFGTWTTSRGDYVDEVLADIENGWTGFEGDCDSTAPCGAGFLGCAGTANAWVCSNNSELVHICDGFLGVTSFSVEAWSNQVGTLAHEKSHLMSGDGDQVHSSCTDNGDTECYGALDARALASNAPAQAVKNGENFEHFVSHAYLVVALLPVVL